MSLSGLLLARVAAGAVGAAALVTGTVFALSGSEGATTAAPLPTAPAAATADGTAVDTSPVASETAAAVQPGQSPAAGGSTDLGASATVAPVRPISQAPAATPNQAAQNQATPTSPAVITDLPAYKDTQVLALAASVVLPSGKTFEQCVALGPNGARWPVPVHLYYEGKGKWIVETHLGEVETEFDEASATFRVKHFAPEASECLR